MKKAGVAVALALIHILLLCGASFAAGAKRPTTKKRRTNLHFYFHDIVTGDKKSAVRVAEAPQTKQSPTMFGGVVVIDDLLTETPDANSTVVGHAQGIYVGASQREVRFAMIMNFVFSSGKFNGSSLAMLGSNPVLQDVREMPIVGGSGAFRFASGYFRAHTFSADKAGNAVVEYNATVFH